MRNAGLYVRGVHRFFLMMNVGREIVAAIPSQRHEAICLLLALRLREEHEA